MKASFFALATMALGAFAAPASVEAKAVAERAPVTEVLNEVTDIVNGGSVITVVTDLVHSVTASTGNINGVLDSFKAGEIEQAEAEGSIFDEISVIKLDLTNIITKLTGQAGIPVAPTDVDEVLALVDVLLKQVLTTVNAVVTVLGLRPQLTSLLHSVFSLLANLLILLNGLLAGLLPGLVATLSPLLASLGNGLLVPLLTPIVGLVAGIAL